MNLPTFIVALGLAATSLTGAFSEARAEDQMVTLSPQQIGDIFCLSRLGNDEAVLDGLLSPVLAASIALAEARNAVIQAAAPDEKPPLGDGIPWQAFPDYAPQCSATISAGAIDQVNIAYAFPDQPDASWVDTLILVKDGPHLRIDDVAFGTTGTLREVLGGMFPE